MQIKTIFEMKTEVQIKMQNEMHFDLRFPLVAIARKSHKWIRTAKWRQIRASGLL